MLLSCRPVRRTCTAVVRPRFNSNFLIPIPDPIPFLILSLIPIPLFLVFIIPIHIPIPNF